MMNFAVFASGFGSNLQAIIASVKKGGIKANLSLVISDKEKAVALERARKAGIKTFFINPKDFENREAFDREVAKRLKEENIDFIVLAGFMRLLSPYFISEYRNKIINIHPSFLPAFKGMSAIKDAFEAGVKETGVTVHFVDEEVDHGPVILQERVGIGPHDTLESLEERIHKVEHELYPKAIDLFAQDKLKIEGDIVYIT